MLQTREFVNNKQPIYKIGRTQQPLLKRFNQYSKGSVLIIHMNVKDSRISEKEIISVFTKQFTCKKELGREYFEGDISKMKKSLFEICCREDETQNEEESEDPNEMKRTCITQQPKTPVSDARKTSMKAYYDNKKSQINRNRLLDRLKSGKQKGIQRAKLEAFDWNDAERAFLEPLVNEKVTKKSKTDGLHIGRVRSRALG